MTEIEEKMKVFNETRVTQKGTWQLNYRYKAPAIAVLKSAKFMYDGKVDLAWTIEDISDQLCLFCITIKGPRKFVRECAEKLKEAGE